MCALPFKPQSVDQYSWFGPAGITTARLAGELDQCVHPAITCFL